MSIALDQVRIFFGELTAAVGRVYMQLPRPSDGGEVTVQGVVSGPRCRYARTLPARVPFRPQASTESLLAQAIVTDPCCWTAEMPFLYDVAVQVLRGDNVIAEIKQPLGFRPLAASRRGLRFGGANWMLRGACRSAVTESELSGWHDRDTALVLPAPGDDLCCAASELGVLVVAVLGGSHEQIERELGRVARHPAVGLAILSGGLEAGVELRSAGRNLVLMQSIDLEGTTIAPWAQAVVADATDLDAFVALIDRIKVPILARRRIGETTAPVDARAACDRLQRDVITALRSHGGRIEPAGYLV